MGACHKRWKSTKHISGVGGLTFTATRPLSNVSTAPLSFSPKENGKSHDEEVKYFAECFDEFVLGHGKELFLVDEAGMEYLIAREYKNAPINLIDWIVDSSEMTRLLSQNL